MAHSPEDTANSNIVDSGSVSKEEEETQQHEEEKDEHKDHQQTKATTIAPRSDLAAELTFVQERLEAIAKYECFCLLLCGEMVEQRKKKKKRRDTLFLEQLRTIYHRELITFTFRLFSQ